MDDQHRRRLAQQGLHDVQRVHLHPFPRVRPAGLHDGAVQGSARDFRGQPPPFPE